MARVASVELHLCAQGGGWPKPTQVSKWSLAVCVCAAVFWPPVALAGQMAWSSDPAGRCATRSSSGWK
jgi:hypothetical protein